MIQIAVSACLVGRPVRYDGADKLHSRVAGLASRFALVEVCPEVELGLGVPRLPIERVPGGGLRVIESRRDLTAAMTELARCRLPDLVHIAGYVFKQRSPSCGLTDVRFAGHERPGRGLFAELVVRQFPDLPVVEETQLDTAAGASAFVDAVLGYDAARRS